LGGISYAGVAQAINCGATGNLVSNINVGIQQVGVTSTGTSIVGNTANSCFSSIFVANTGQANYVASANN
jgi:protein-disulfide isomerase